MNAVTAWLSGSLVDRVGWGLIHFLWQGATIAVVLAAGLRLMRRSSARARYAAACLALAAMAGCVPLTAWLASFAPLPAWQQGMAGTPAAVGAGATGADVAPAEPAPPFVAENTDPPWMASSALAADSSGVGSEEAVDGARGAGGFVGLLSRLLQCLPRWVVGAWLLGALSLSLWHGAGWLRVRRLARVGNAEAPDALRRLLAEWLLRLRIRRAVRLLVSTAVHAPMVLGWLRPVILVPASLITQLPPQQWEMILAHELAHVRRCDYLLNLLQTAVETLLFYHPAVWWVSAKIRQAREECCDDLALAQGGSPLVYARALTSLAELGLSARTVSRGNFGLAAHGGRLYGRIRRVLGLPPAEGAGRQTSPGALWGAALVIAALVTGMVWAGGTGRPEGPLPASAPADEAATLAGTDSAATPASVPAVEAPKPASSPAAKDSGKPASSLELRLSVLGEPVYRGFGHLPLQLELRNVSGQRVYPPIITAFRLAVEVVDEKGSALRVAKLLNVTPWEGRTMPPGLAAGAAIRWEVNFGHLQFLDRPPRASKVRLRFRLSGEMGLESNWLELAMLDAPPVAADKGTFAGVWAPQVDLVYRDHGASFYADRALHVDHEGRATVVSVSGGEDPWYGRHETTLPRERLDRVAELLKRDEAWTWSDLKPAPVGPDDHRFVEFAYSSAGRLLRFRLPIEQVRQHPGLAALHKEMQELMAAVVEAARTSRAEWPPETGDGLQCRLRADKPAWRLGETPTFQAALRNAGMRDLSICRTEVVAELELNGVWYGYGARFSAISSPFPPGKQYDGIRISLSRHWRLKDSNAPLVLARGKYTLRAAFTAQEWEGGVDRTPVRFVSNPVTFTLGDGPVEPSAPLPLTLQLEARVVGPDDKPVPSSGVSFWRAVDPTAVKEPSRIPPSPFGDPPSTWVEPVTGRTWELLHYLDRVEQVATMPGLSVGNYRVTAHVNSAPDFASNEPVVGASGVIHLDGSKPKTVEVVRLDSGPSLTVEVLDAATGKPIPNARLRLLRPDGLPVVARAGGWFVYARNGRVRYPHLAPGRYALHVERRAEHFGDVSYADVPELVMIDLPAGRNTEAAVRLTPAPFDSRENERRWPWVVTGKVTDAQGKPLEGVTIAAVCGGSGKVGETRSGKDGSYSVRFTGSGYTFDSDAKRWRTSSQPVEIVASMPGRCEQNLGRHGEIAIAEETPRVNVGSRKPEEFLLPGQARQIDFVMVPAVTLEGQLLDEAGNPLPNAQLGLHSDTMPRSARPRSTRPSDSQGRFQFDGLAAGFACRITAFSTRDRSWGVLSSPPFALSTPGTYRVKVQRVVGAQPRGRLDVVSLTDPLGAEIRDTVIRPEEP